MTATQHWTNDVPETLEKRDIWKSIKRGLLCRCPKCGQGRLFGRFLKPVDNCATCGEDLTHHRADDLPAYLVIVIVGHLTVGGFMMTDMVWTMSNWAHLAIWTPMTLILALALIQPVKGGVIGLQWATRMHGFGGSEPKPEDTLN